MHGWAGEWGAKILEWLHGGVVCNVASDLRVGRRRELVLVVLGDDEEAGEREGWGGQHFGRRASN